MTASSLNLTNPSPNPHPDPHPNPHPHLVLQVLGGLIAVQLTHDLGHAAAAAAHKVKLFAPYLNPTLTLALTPSLTLTLNKHPPRPPARSSYPRRTSCRRCRYALRTAAGASEPYPLHTFSPIHISALQVTLHPAHRCRRVRAVPITHILTHNTHIDGAGGAVRLGHKFPELPEDAQGSLVRSAYPPSSPLSRPLSSPCVTLKTRKVRWSAVPIHLSLCLVGPLYILYPSSSLCICPSSSFLSNRAIHSHFLTATNPYSHSHPRSYPARHSRS